MQKEIKYIVVGQGLAGTILSFQLFKRGITHVVVGSNRFGTSSEVAAGMFNPLVFKRITKSWMVDELYPVMHSVYKELENLLDQKFVHSLPIAKLISPHEKDWWNERVTSQHLESYFKGFLPSGELPGIKSAFEIAHVTQSGYADLSLLLSAYRKWLIEHDAFLNEEFNYNDLSIDNGMVAWNGIKAEKIIFCEGAAAKKNPFFSEVKFYLTKGEVLEVEIGGLTQEFIINKDVFLLPIGNRRYRLGSTYDHNDLSWRPNSQAAEKLLGKAEALIDCKITLIDHKAGVRPTISDRRPVLGRHPKYSNVYIFNGLGTKGVMLAPYFSGQMVELMENEAFDVHKEVNVGRFYTKH